MAEGDIVRNVKIVASGENIDSTKASVVGLTNATDNAAKSADNTKLSLVNVAAGLYVAKTAFEAVTTASDGASESLGKTASAAAAAASYLPKVVGDIWQEGIDKLNRYVELSNKAGTLSTDFYQAMTLGAINAKKPAEEYLKVINNINSALDQQLGTNGIQNGSAFNTQVLELQKNGNLQGQTADVNRLNNAVTSPEQLKASLALIQGALENGEKLIGFKLAGTLLGPEATDNLKKDNDYIFQMQKSIESVQNKDIIQQPDIDRAVAMKTEFENAKKIIDSWFAPREKGDWSALGIEFQQLWLNANQNFAATLTWLDKIFYRTKEIANIKPDNPEDSIWTKIGDYFGGKSMEGRMNDADRQLEIAKQSLASRLGNSQNIKSAREESQRASDWLTPDQSSPAPAAAEAQAKAIRDVKDAYGRAEESLLKYIETTKAATNTVGLGAGAQEKARAIAQLTAAGLKDGLSPAAAKAKAEMSGLGDAAGVAADGLAKAKVAAEIQFNKNALFLSPEDLSIANQLKGIYGNDIPRALGSSEAAGIRFNDTIKSLKDGGISFTTTFADGLLHGKSIMDSLASAADGLSKKLLDFGLTSLINSGLGALTGGGSSATSGAALATGGTSAAAAITAACTAGGAALAAGGAAAGTAIGTGGTVAGVGIDVGTSVGGAALVTAGATTAVTLETAGAVTGTLINGPILALLAVIVSIGASLFSSNNQKAQQHAADVAAWKAQSDAFNSFIDTLNGKGPSGSLADATSKVMQQYKTFAEAAAKAGDIASVIQAQNAVNKFQIDQAYAFGATFKATLQGMADGLGKDSPFLKAVENVKTELANVQGFVADAATANRIAGVADVGQATAAAKTYLLSLLQTVPAMSAVATSLATLGGTSATLQGALESLGMSSADAAKAINDGVVTAMKQITATFTDGLQREINSATGQDYNNSLADLVKQFQSNLADAAKLGLDPSIVNQWFKVSAQKIVNDAGLAGSAMANLVLQFPQLAGVITEASSVLAQAVTDAQTALNTANANVATAQGNLISAYNTESSALQATIDKTNSYIQSLKDLGNSLKLNPQLSTLSPQQQYAAAKAIAESDAKLAAGGDVAAQGRLQNDLTTFLDQSKSFNASTEAYYADFQEVQGILTQAEANGQVTVSVAQQQLNVLTSQVSLLVQINSSVLTVAQAISALNVATGTASVAQKTLDTATTAAKPPASGGTLGTVAALYQAIDGRAPDAAGAAYWQSKIDAGLTGSALVSAFTAASIASSNHETVNPAIRAAYGYADGGLVTNGTYNQDSVYAKLAGNEHVTRASSVNAATFSTLSYINQNGRVPGNDGQDMRELGRIIATGNQQVLEALDNINKTYAVGSHKIAEETRKAGKQPVIRQTGNG